MSVLSYGFVNCNVMLCFQQVSFTEQNRIVSFYSHSNIFIFILCIDRNDTANSSKYKSSMQWQTVGFYGFFFFTHSLVSCHWDGNFSLTTTFIQTEISQQLLNEQQWNTEQTFMFHPDFGDPLNFPLAQRWFKVKYFDNYGMGCHDICYKFSPLSKAVIRSKYYFVHYFCLWQNNLLSKLMTLLSASAVLGFSTH